MAAFVAKAPDAGLVFIDGHADFHTAATSPTGDPADMELAVLTGRGAEQITHAGERYPILHDDDVVVYGIRAWDHVDESNIAVYDSVRLREAGIGPAVESGMEKLIKRTAPVWLHFDVDVLDPEVMPVMFPEPGGLSFDEAETLLGAVWDSSRVGGMSVACYHPWLDANGLAGRRLAELIAEVLSRPGKETNRGGRTG
jgi:arginase